MESSGFRLREASARPCHFGFMLRRANGFDVTEQRAAP
jgi:hypothetical protein